jgi:hypothetical protein
MTLPVCLRQFIARFNCGVLLDAWLDGEAEALRSLRMGV